MKEFERLIKEFQDIPISPEFTSKPATLMEIAGFPHYENVCSNILRFYFNPAEAHGLGDLLLKSLLRAVGNDSLKIQGDVTVSREVQTIKGGRLDLVIEWDTAVVGIENKIFASAYNDFPDYHATLKEKANKRELVPILLTLGEIPAKDQPPRFTHLTYSKWFETLRQEIGHYATDADPRYLAHFLEFLTTIENRKGRSGMNITQETVEFLRKNLKDVGQLVGEVKRIQGELTKRVEEVKDRIDLQAAGCPLEIQPWVYVSQKDLLQSVLVFDIPVAPDKMVAVDCRYSIKGWEIVVWTRRSGGVSWLLPYLKERNIQFITHPDEKDRFLLAKNFSFEEDSQVMADGLTAVVLELVKEVK